MTTNIPTDEQSPSLQRETEKYWKKLRRNHNDPFPTQCEYVRELLPQEMEGKEAPQPCETLVLLVGHSIEPLLQAVWVYQPKRLVLILNRQYGATLSGKDFAHQIINLLSQLPQERQVNKDQILPRDLIEVTPAQVFALLLQEVREQTNVVIDITGAKKSMVAGAFLYAAYAHVPVSYVDFDDAMYSTEFGRPYGYASEIRVFQNPYSVFALRNWERVRELYLGYHFREARRLLEAEIQPVMEETDYFEDTYLSSAKRLAQVLKCYEFWDSGDFYESRHEVQSLRNRGIDFNPPTAIILLSDVWPHVEHEMPLQGASANLLQQHGTLARGEAGPINSFFCREDWLIVYAEDELARTQRLIDFNEDYRSAFLRTASLNEVLLKARLAGLWHEGRLQPPVGKDLILFEDLVDRVTAMRMLRLLTQRQTLHVSRERGAILSPEVESMAAFWDDHPLALDRLIELRNKTIHTYLPIPRSIAQTARGIAEANLQDYRENWAKRMPPTTVTEALPWSCLCKLSGVDAFLPPNLWREEESHDETPIGC